MKKLIILAALVTTVLGFALNRPSAVATSSEHRMIDPTVWGTTVSDLNASTPDIITVGEVIISNAVTATKAPESAKHFACTSKMENLVGGYNSICAWL